MNIKNIFQSLFSHNEKSDPHQEIAVTPAFWWANLPYPRLQLILKGEDLTDCKVKIESDGDIKVEDTIHFPNPHYMAIYLNVAQAKPQQFHILLKKGWTEKRIPYTLRARRTDTYAQGFDATDTVYLLMPDRFAQGETTLPPIKGLKENTFDRTQPDARHGGNIQGIIDHLDYFKQLGITTLWTTPVLENDMPDCSYHGYAITNYYKVDSRLGTNEDYARLVSEAHKKGLKVIMDMVFNHCGSEHPLFKDMPYTDWFSYGNTYTPTNHETVSPTDLHAAATVQERTTEGWFVKTMPNWNQRNPHVQQYLIQTSLWWIEYAGIDGIRQDTYPYCDAAFMASWCKTLRDIYPQLNIVGETWLPDNVSTACWQKDNKLTTRNPELPTVMQFPLLGPLRLENGFHSLENLYAQLTQDIVYADPLHTLIFLENHDTERYFRTQEEARDIERYKMSVTMLLTLRGIPQLYQGTEVAQYGDKKEGDGAMRKDFPGGWKDDKTNAFTGEKLTSLQREAQDFTRRLLHWRSQCEAIGKGSLTHYPPKEDTYIYIRRYKTQQVTVILNVADHPKMLETTLYKEAFPKSEAKHILLGGTKQPIKTRFALTAKDIQILEFTLSEKKS